MLIEYLVVVQEFVSYSLLGLIWIVQVVHYPSFHFIDSAKFTKFEQFHASRITWIVMPLMLVEMVTTIALVYFEANWVTVTNLLLVLFIWISTFLLSIPRHNKLLNGKDEKIISELVLTNWPRTILWSIKAFIVLCYS